MSEQRPISPIVDVLKNELKTHEYLDVGKGTEKILNVSQTKLRNALTMLQAEGYVVHKIKFLQTNTDKVTIIKVLTNSQKSWAYAKLAVNLGQVKTVQGVK